MPTKKVIVYSIFLLYWNHPCADVRWSSLRKKVIIYEKGNLRMLTLVSIGIFMVGMVLIALGASGATTSTDPTTSVTTATGGNTGLASIALLVLVTSSIVYLISWIGALIKTAQLSRWGWFVTILVLGIIPLLVYIFAGPETPNTSQMAYQPPPTTH